MSWTFLCIFKAVGLTALHPPRNNFFAENGRTWRHSDVICGLVTISTAVLEIYQKVWRGAKKTTGARVMLDFQRIYFLDYIFFTSMSWSKSQDKTFFLQLWMIPRHMINDEMRQCQQSLSDSLPDRTGSFWPDQRFPSISRDGFLRPIVDGQALHSVTDFTENCSLGVIRTSCSKSLPCL